MTKRYYIKTIEDVKYCEENNLVIKSTDDKICSYAFEGNCWVYYLEGKPALYNASIMLCSKLYYEAPKQEVTEDDLGCFKHCRKLSPSEVAELTGYKVEKAE